MMAVVDFLKLLFLAYDSFRKYPLPFPTYQYKQGEAGVLNIASCIVFVQPCIQRDVFILPDKPPGERISTTVSCADINIGFQLIVVVNELQAILHTNSIAKGCLCRCRIFIIAGQKNDHGGRQDKNGL